MNFRSTFLYVISAVSLLVSAAPANASPAFPEALQEVTEMPCIPSCVVCHGVDPGTANTFTKRKLGGHMFNDGARTPNVAEFKAAYAKYAANQANAASVTALKSGIDPETGDKLCSVTYGCGARIAKSAPPPDDWSGLTFVGGAMLFGVLLRRYKRR